MIWSPTVQDIVNTMINRYGELAKGDDDQRRELAERIAEQVVYTTGDPTYGVKSAGPGRPQGKDSLAWNGPGGLVIWDYQNGSTREANQFPESVPVEEAAGQIFIPVQARDWLGGSADSNSAPTDQSPSVPLPSYPVEAGATREQIINLRWDIDEFREDFHNSVAKLYDQNERIFADMTAQIKEIKALLTAGAVNSAQPPSTVHLSDDTWKGLESLASRLFNRK